MVAGRVSFETNVLTSTKVDGIIVRPAVFYGRGGGTWWGSIFESALAAGEKGEPLETTSMEEGRFSVCHVDVSSFFVDSSLFESSTESIFLRFPQDIADLVRRVAEKVSRSVSSFPFASFAFIASLSTVDAFDEINA